MLFVPGEIGDTQAFITNERITAENAKAWVNHCAYRWWIEAEYRSIKQHFLARTSSTDYTLRFYYFVFGVLMYNVWRLTDVLLKTTVSRELTTAPPVLTTGELKHCAERQLSANTPQTDDHHAYSQDTNCNPKVYRRV